MIRLAKRKKNSHKGDYGRVFIIAGSLDYSGAAVLCANAAIRSGAGMVTLGVPSSIFTVTAARVLPEIIVRRFPSSPQGAFSEKSLPKMLEFVEKNRKCSVVIGPGLSQAPSVIKVVKGIATDLKSPVIVDADGINALSKIVFPSVRVSSNLILTPHPGEAARLLGVGAEDVQRDRINSAVKIAKKYGAICVLKGHGTVVTDGARVYVNKTGNPGMATAGSGDVLAGMLGAMINQISPLYEAVKTAVYLHGLAGDISKRILGEVSMTASDIVENIPAAVKKLQR